jgi:hypothetical protein
MVLEQVHVLLLFLVVKEIRCRADLRVCNDRGILKLSPFKLLL